jgi:predicted CXXCH cytochrome family protein
MARIVMRGKAVLIAAAICMLFGCDPLTSHKITASLFDGVPSLPPAEQYCQDYHKQALIEEREAEKKLAGKKQSKSSSHPPYVDKRCNDCHDKNTDSGFVVAKEELCSVCHRNFLKEAYSHGPAAVGACLNCHIPHDSQYQSLLKKPITEICGVCHVEQRLTKSMHDNVVAKGMSCTECHDPHSGNNKFFLR